MFLFARHLLAKGLTKKKWHTLCFHRLNFSRHHQQLRIRFLIDYYPLHNRFQTEAGVSYLVSTDTDTVLFDLAFNQKRKTPSPLRINLNALDLESCKLNGIFISHNHRDHVGGLLHQLRKVPAVEHVKENDSAETIIWTPIPMQHPHYLCAKVPCPMELRPGLASTGPLPAHLYFLGMIHEQALLVALQEKGLVLISGCGHPGIVEMVRFAQQITDQNIYAVVGGLHLITTKGRDPIQKYLGANQPPWMLPDQRSVRNIVEELRSLGVEKIAPSAHDSCDAALRIMQDVFGGDYIEVRVGDEIFFTAE